MAQVSLSSLALTFRLNPFAGEEIWFVRPEEGERSELSRGGGLLRHPNRTVSLIKVLVKKVNPFHPHTCEGARWEVKIELSRGGVLTDGLGQKESNVRCLLLRAMVQGAGSDGLLERTVDTSKLLRETSGAKDCSGAPPGCCGLGSWQTSDGATGSCTGSPRSRLFRLVLGYRFGFCTRAVHSLFQRLVLRPL